MIRLFKLSVPIGFLFLSGCDLDACLFDCTNKNESIAESVNEKEFEMEIKSMRLDGREIEGGAVSSGVMIYRNGK